MTSAWWRLIRLEWARMIRSGGFAVSVLLLIAVGAYAAWEGRQRLEAAEESASSAETGYRDQLAFLLERLGPTEEAGFLLYYLAVPSPQPPSRLSGLASGRTAVETADLRIRLLALEGQLYEPETLNPRLAAAGRLDLAFVLIALLPLFIIAITYSLVSGERERGTWRLAQLFAPSGRLIAAKTAARVLLVGGLVASLTGIGAALTGLDGDGRAGWAAALLALHTAFWFALCLGVATGRRSSTANAMALVGVWVAVTFLAPAVLSLVNAILHPVPEALELTVRQRQGYHEAWDLPRQETMDSFFEDYPEWSDWIVPEDRFSWAWYYAMNHRGDQAARDASRAYRDILKQRDAWARRWSLLAPPLATRIALDRLASVDLAAQLAYQEAVRRFHERLKIHFQPTLFADATNSQVDWSRVPAFEPAASATEAAAAGLPAAASLTLASLLALLLGGAGRRESPLSVLRRRSRTPSPRAPRSRSGWPG